MKEEVDLIVIGAGAGGMTTALVAGLEGCDVLLCEATGQVGGTTATSAGTIWVPNSSASRQAGFEDSQQDAMRYLDGLVPSGAGRALREAYLRSGPAIIDDLARRTALQFVPAGKHPDYVDIPGSRVFGRALAPLPFDGRSLGRDFARIRPPMKEFMVLGGMMVGKADIGHLVGRFKSFASFKHTAGLVLRYMGDRLRHARGTRLVMGNALVARFYASLKAAGVPMSFDTRIDELMLENGKVVGARLLRGGQRIEVRARRGVVLATGGFGRGAHLREQLMPKGHAPWPSLIFEGNQGGGVDAGLRAGAAMDNTEGAGVFWQPVSITRSRQGKPAGLFAHLFLDRAKPGLIAVDSAGQRFTNEGNSYHYFCHDMVERHATVPAIPTWVVCDADFIRKYGLGLVHPGTTDVSAHVKTGYLKCDESLDGLARQIGVDPKGLAHTVMRHNGFAITGIDEDYGKGSTEVSRFNGDPEHKPNPCLGPIARAPFCAMALWPADAAADAGLRTDAHARVLDGEGRVIEGLYAVGNDMASAMRGAYVGPGATIGPAIVFGYRAAMHAKGTPVS
jgi:succinate dehydrogenase/fumarate reductase flavoprotein subunit